MKLTLIRGLPGSGKTTIAEELLGRVGTRCRIHIETDFFWTQPDGDYDFDYGKIAEAHAWCLLTTRLYLLNGWDVIVANTFTTRQEMQSYLNLAKELEAELEIVEATGSYGSTHGVSDEITEKMRARWETI